jgi:Spy/CpxP family protein refolding chaperone
MVSRRILVSGLSLVLAFVMAVCSANAQPGGGRGGPGGGPGGQGGFFGGGGFGGGGLSGVLMREDVRAELELLDSQEDDLRKLAESRMGQMRDMFSGMQGLSREERTQKFQELRDKMQEAQKETENDIAKVLLPHQLKRAKQLAFQLQIRGGISQAMVSDQVAEEFGITDSQKEKLREKAQKLEEELRKKMAELRLEAQKELLKELTPKQQAQWKEKVGEPFEFQQTQQRFGGGNAPGAPAAPGGRGGRGGR